jgi:hypothetical protein
MRLHHVKPHGALYAMLHDQEEVAAAVAEAIRDTSPAPLLYWPSPVEMHALPRAARKLGIDVVGEVYFDLAYPRGEADRRAQEDGEGPGGSPGSVAISRGREASRAGDSLRPRRSASSGDELGRDRGPSGACSRKKGQGGSVAAAAPGGGGSA